jgi:hypothetical protein
MNIFSRLRLLLLEQKLKFGAFGKFNRYRCWRLERNVNSITDRIRLAREVLNGPGVSLAESQHNVDFIRRHSAAAPTAMSRPPKNSPTVIQDTQPLDTSAQRNDSQRLAREYPV